MESTEADGGVTTRCDKRLPVVYVAGPYTAKTRWTQEWNVRAAEHQAYRIAQSGAVPLIPHAMYRHFDGTLDAETWYAYTAELLLRCDALYLLDNWGESKGAVGERRLAIHRQIPIFSSMLVLTLWIKQEWYAPSLRMTFADEVDPTSPGHPGDLRYTQHAVEEDR